MRIALACLMVATAPAWAQLATPKAPPTSAIPDRIPDRIPDKPLAPCADCGVVRTVRAIKKELPPSASTEAQPSGLVASIPLGGGGGKAHVGSSSRYGGDAVTTSQKWEVTVRLDDGRFRVLMFEQQPDVKEGDNVRIDANGQVKIRDH